MSSKKINKPVLVVALVVLILLVAGAYLITSGAFVTTVQNGDTVGVYYTGSFTNGTVFNTNFGQSQPFKFTVGANEVIPGFNNAVIGMRINQTKNVTIPENEAYGPINPNLIMRVPTNEINGTAYIGEVLHGVIGGQSVEGVVMETNATITLLNLNNPLAGKTLVFKITIVSINSSS